MAWLRTVTVDVEGAPKERAFSPVIHVYFLDDEKLKQFLKNREWYLYVMRKVEQHEYPVSIERLKDAPKEAQQCIKYWQHKFKEFWRIKEVWV